MLRLRGRLLGTRSLRCLFEEYLLDTDRRELRRGSALVSIEPQVFDLLVYLIRNRERVVDKEELLVSVWHGRIVSNSALISRVNAARSAIGDSGRDQRLIKTLPKKGMRFVGVVREANWSYSGAAPRQHGPTAATVLTSDQPLALPDRPSIAVLPFTNLSDDFQTYVADGIVEDIITELSRCGELFVVSRNSSFPYKAKAIDGRQVGRELGVRYVLEGSLRRRGYRLRISAQLINAAHRVALLGRALRPQA